MHQRDPFAMVASIALAACVQLAGCGDDAGDDSASEGQSARGEDDSAEVPMKRDAGADAGRRLDAGREAAAPRDAHEPMADEGADTGILPPESVRPDAALTDAARARSDAGSGSTERLPDLSFAGLVSAVELAPVRLAANGIYPGRVTIGSGGVDNLFSLGGPLVATNAETQALRASVQHPDLRIIFTVCEGLYRIVAKRSAGVTALADLRGKSIALPSGTSAHYFLVKMLRLVNLTDQDVVMSPQSPGMAPLTADAATIWEPGIQYVSDQLGADAIEFQKDEQGQEVYRELFNLHATAASLADPQKRQTIVGFVRALVVASEQLRADPSAVWPLLTGPSGASQAVLEKSWHYERFAGTLVSDLLDVLEEEEQWRAKIDGRSARTRAQLAPLVDDSVLNEALAM